MDLRERRATPHGDGERHPWERARLAVVRRLLRAHGGDVKRIIDLGAGDGYVARALAANGFDVIAVDPAFSDADLAELAAGGVDARRDAPAPGERAVVLLLDVIEHVADDVALLSVARALAGDGVVIVTVPAWPALWSHNDVALAHHRRYAPRGLASACTAAGLVISEQGGLFASLIAPRALTIAAERVWGARRRATSAVASWRAPEAISALITSALVADAYAGRWLGASGAGLSLYAVCRGAS